MSKLAKRQQAGDTIVEVLVCLAIVGFALSICYSIAQRSLLQVRQSEEHSQSLELAQGQLERFREYLSLTPAAQTSNPASFIPGGANQFCIVLSSGNLVVKSATNPQDTICAANQNGVYYCDVVACGGSPGSIVDTQGYTYRVSISYPTNNDEFYGIGDRSALVNTSNTLRLDAVSIPYRIHQ